MRAGKINPKETVTAPEAIRVSELNFHSLFAAMTEGVAIHQMIYDAGGKAMDYIIRDVNPSFEKNLGIPADKAKGQLGSKVYGLTPPPYIDIYEHVLKTREPYFFTTFFKPLDRYFEISVFLPKEDWVAAVFLDVTGSKRVLEELRATSIKYRRLYESMMDGFVRTDMQGKIKEFNSCFREMLGYTDKELLELSYVDITPEEWHRYENRIINNQVIPYGYSSVFEKEYRKKDGTIVPVELRVSLIRDESGRPEGMWGVVRDITDRKRSENELERMIDRFNLAARSGNLGVWDWDIRSGEVIWDDKMLELYGIEREQFQNTHEEWLNLVHPDDRTRVKEEINLALSGEKEYDSEFRIILKDGIVRTIKTYAEVVRDSKGEALRFTGINFDISEQKRTRESLIISEMFNRGLVESAPVGLLFLDQSGMITYENPAMQQMMGIPEGAESVVIGKFLKDLPPIREVMNPSEILAILEGKKIHAREVHYKSLMGREVDLEIYTAPLPDKEGKVRGIILMAVDITEPIAAEKELRESEQKYRKLYESMRDGFVLLDMNKHVVEFNSFFLTMTGYTAGEVTAMKSIREIVPEKWHEKVDVIINKQIHTVGYTEIFEIEYRRKDNTTFPVEVRLFLHKNQKGEEAGMWAIIRDITQRKKMEMELTNMNANLEQKVEQKTKELQERVKELERFYKATIDRELRLKEMRSRIEELESEMEKMKR